MGSTSPIWNPASNEFALAGGSNDTRLVPRKVAMNRFAMNVFMAVFCASMLPAYTAAQSPADAAKPAQPVTVCRERAHVTGSHIPAGRRCKTAEQWAAKDERLTQVPVTMRLIRASDKPIEGSH